MGHVIFCLFSDEHETVYNDVVPKYFPPTAEDLADLRELDEESDSGLPGEIGERAH
jgi:hypothetical protein